METIHLKSWAEFKSRLDEIERRNEEFRVKHARSFSELLFRGQADSAWKLETTLERRGVKSIGVADYQKTVSSALRYVGNFMSQKFSVDTDSVATWDSLSWRLPNYELIAYLRHHGFPSPLMDWTASPYVAAFFAFSDPPQTQPQNVAIYAYQEYRGMAKSTFSDAVKLHTMGPWAVIHERHVIQQSWYTYCYREEANEPVFRPHEEVDFEQPSFDEPGQDVLWKFEIPFSQRPIALHELSRMNITPYSIYRTEEALIETVARQLFDNK